MDRHERDSAEIDLLVSELTAKRHASPQAPSRETTGTSPTEPRPSGRWTNVHFVMPSRPAASHSKRFAFASGIALPQWPDVVRLIPMPGPVVMVRIWVALGAVHSALMTFWPYPKTYLLGLVVYLLSLGLVLVTGVWGARLSWDARLGAAHTVALGTAGWAVALAAIETLPPV